MCLQNLSINRPSAYHKCPGSGYKWERDSAWRCTAATEPTLSVYSWLHSGKEGRERKKQNERREEKRRALSPSPTNSPHQTELRLELWTRLAMTAHWASARKTTTLTTEALLPLRQCSTVWSLTQESETPSCKRPKKRLNRISLANLTSVQLMDVGSNPNMTLSALDV